MSDEKVYGVRYRVEHWNKPAENKGKKVANLVRVSDDDHGYADVLFLASIVFDDDGQFSILLMDSMNGPKPSRRILEAVRYQIDHHLEHHMEEDGHAQD